MKTKSFYDFRLAICLSAILAVFLGEPLRAQTILGKHPADKAQPAFFSQNGNANAIVDGINTNATHGLDGSHLADGSVNSNKLDAATRAMLGSGGPGGGSGNMVGSGVSVTGEVPVYIGADGLHLGSSGVLFVNLALNAYVAGVSNLWYNGSNTLNTRISGVQTFVNNASNHTASVSNDLNNLKGIAITNLNGGVFTNNGVYMTNGGVWTFQRADGFFIQSNGVSRTAFIRYTNGNCALLSNNVIMLSNNAANGNLTIAGAFIGNGAQLTSLNGANLSGGSVNSNAFDAGTLAQLFEGVGNITPLTLGADLVEQINGSSAQTFNIYYRYAGASDYKRLSTTFDGSGNMFQSYEGIGSSTNSGDWYQQIVGAHSIRWWTRGIERWRLGNDGIIDPGTDNAYDFGRNGGNRVRSIYVGTKVQLPNPISSGTNDAINNTNAMALIFANTTGLEAWAGSDPSTNMMAVGIVSGVTNPTPVGLLDNVSIVGGNLHASGTGNSPMVSSNILIQTTNEIVWDISRVQHLTLQFNTNLNRLKITNAWAITNSPSGIVQLDKWEDTNGTWTILTTNVVGGLWRQVGSPSWFGTNASQYDIMTLKLDGTGTNVVSRVDTNVQPVISFTNTLTAGGGGGGGGGSISLINTASKAGTGSGTTTTDPVDTTGASGFIMFVTFGTPSDSKGLTWTQRSVNSGGVSQVAYTAFGTGGTGHTFSTTGGYNVIAYAVSGVSAFDTEAHAGSTGNWGSTPIQTGNMTPSGSDSFSVVSAAYNIDVGSNPLSVNNSYTVLTPNLWGASFGLQTAYKIKSSNSAENPTLTDTLGSNPDASAIGVILKP